MEEITLLFLILAIALFVVVAILGKRTPVGLRFIGLIASVGDLAFTLTDTTLPDIEYAVSIMVILAFAMIVYHLWEIITDATGNKR